MRGRSPDLYSTCPVRTELTPPPFWTGLAHGCTKPKRARCAGSSICCRKWCGRRVTRTRSSSTSAQVQSRGRAIRASLHRLLSASRVLRAVSPPASMASAVPLPAPALCTTGQLGRCRCVGARPARTPCPHCLLRAGVCVWVLVREQPTPSASSRPRSASTPTRCTLR